PPQPRPPTPTPLPYTTLFRSILARQAHVQQHQIGSFTGQSLAQGLTVTTAFHPKALAAEVVAEQLPHLGVVVHHQQSCLFRHTLDRKSTRLNSSHVKISYAVF